MKGKRLLTAAMVGMLVFGGIPTTVYAEVAPEYMEESEQEDKAAVQAEDIITDQAVPLAALSTQRETNKFTWWGFILGFLAASIVETGIWAVYKSRDEKRKPE